MKSSDIEAQKDIGAFVNSYKDFLAYRKVTCGGKTLREISFGKVVHGRPLSGLSD